MLRVQGDRIYHPIGIPVQLPEVQRQRVYHQEKEEMIKAKGAFADGTKFMLFGLSEGNIKLLKEGKPILVDLAEIGLPHMGKVFIVYGETEEAITKQFKEAGLLSLDDMVDKSRKGN